VTPYFAGLFLFTAAAVTAGVPLRRAVRAPAYIALVVAGAVSAAIPAVRVLATGTALTARVASSLPGGEWVFGIDALSAVFLLAVLGIGAATAVFGIFYTVDSHAPGAAHHGHTVFALLVAAMAVLVAAQTVTLFLCAWECMAIGTYLLILTDDTQADARRAGLIYLVATHAGTLALFGMFACMTRGAADWSFATIAAAHSAGGAAVFALALVGFGVKAGLVPLHFWLPSAHTAAPTHASALLSGIVIKMGIYGLLRVASLAVAPEWWGWTVLGLGVTSAFLGVLWALAQHDIKRLLAYHSIENIGIILMGIGVGALGSAYAHPVLAVLGYGAAALHSVNHALFKTMLFLAAGAVQRATGTRNMEELGGMGRRMPLTWLVFLIASVAIIGLPPLNGFVSEWLVFQGLFRAGQAAGTVRLVVLGVPALALVSGLALACFAKVCGTVFLGTPRSPRPALAREAGFGMLAPALSLGVACVVIGVAPALILPSIFRIGASVAGAGSAPLGDELAQVLGDSQRLSVVAAGLLLTAGLAWLARFAVLRGRVVRSADVWACGYGAVSPRMQYTASSFAAPLLDVFGGLAGVETHDGATVFHTTAHDLVLDRAVLPLWNRVRQVALRLRPIQQGRLHVYVLYIMATLVILLTYLVFAPGA
jgi:hydrogenase-4 component B